MNDTTSLSTHSCPNTLILPSEFISLPFPITTRCSCAALCARGPTSPWRLTNRKPAVVLSTCLGRNVLQEKCQRQAAETLFDLLQNSLAIFFLYVTQKLEHKKLPAGCPWFAKKLQTSWAECCWDFNRTLLLATQSMCHWLVHSYLLLCSVHRRSSQHIDGSSRLETKALSFLFLPPVCTIFLNSYSDISFETPSVCHGLLPVQVLLLLPRWEFRWPASWARQRPPTRQNYHPAQSVQKVRLFELWPPGACWPFQSANNKIRVVKAAEAVRGLTGWRLVKGGKS